MRGRELLARMREEVLIGDGALGTMLSEHGVGHDIAFERLNQSRPDLVRAVHQAYITAGAQVIETNTFAANRTKLADCGGEEVALLNRLGAALAREAAGTTAFVAGSVGPLAEAPGGREITPLTDDAIREIFREQIVALAQGGVDVLLLETFTDLRQLLLALDVARSETDLPVFCQMAFHEKGHTQSGVHVLTALDALLKAKADVIGANCGRGVRCVMHAVKQLTQHSDALISAFPNAGLPQFLDGRYLFGAPLPYLTDSAVQMADLGVNLIGGCCGTTPAFIQRLAERLRNRKPAPRVRIAAPLQGTIGVLPTTVPAEPSAPTTYGPLPAPSGTLLDHFADRDPVSGLPTRPLVVVEIDPPRGLNWEPMLRRVQQLRDMGVDAITVADNPVATLHMGNLTFADILQREADIPVILHLTGRDSNLLGLQSRLLEAHTRGVHHILALTGDPARVGDMPGATSVYDLNSFGIVELLTRFNHGVNAAGQSIGGRTKFAIGVAFNPNGRNLKGLIDRLERKIAKGAHFALTQPLYDPVRFDEMMAGTRSLGIPIFAGLLPLLSEKNAEYLHNEVPGIALTDEVRKRMKGLSGKEGRKVGTKICVELLDHMLPKADAFYLIPPQRFTEMAVDLVAHIRSRSAVSVAG